MTVPCGAEGEGATRALIVAPQWIGDAVMTQPLLAKLAARGAQITVAALPWVAPVYRAMPQVQAVIEWPLAHGRLDAAKRWRLARELRGRFDAAYVLPNSLKSALIPWLARIPVRIGYRGEARFVLLNRRSPNPTGRPPMVAFYSALAGEPTALSEHPSLRFDATVLDAATRTAQVQQGAYWAFACWPAFGPPPGRAPALSRCPTVPGPSAPLDPITTIRRWNIFKFFLIIRSLSKIDYSN